MEEMEEMEEEIRETLVEMQIQGGTLVMAVIVVMVVMVVMVEGAADDVANP